MKKPSTNKLAVYSALVGGALAATAGSADAQIIHTDVNPDDSITGQTDSLLLDLNNDAVVDFRIWLNHGGSSNNIRLTPTMGNEVLGSLSGGWFYPFTMNMNDAINSTQNTWNGTANGGLLTMAWVYTAGGTYGNWFGATDKYLGLRFFIGSDLHYGWARLDVDQNATWMVLKEYAYQAQPDVGLLAGQTIGIEEAQEASFDVYAHNTTVHVTLENVNDGKIMIQNMLGQTIKDVEITDTKMEIDLSDVEAGIYLVAVQSEEGSFTKKVYIQ